MNLRVAVPYYDLTKVKLNLNITGSGKDTQLANWNDEAESEINDVLFDKATKARRIISLPVLPFASGSVPETVQGAADHYVIARYYEFIKNMDMAKVHDKKSNDKLNRYISRLTVERVIYGRIV